MSGVARGVLALLVVLVVLRFDPVMAQEDVPDQCRTIVGCADAGPEPEHPGDRGGYAQFLTLGVIVAGLGFIALRITLTARRKSSDQAG